MNRVIGVDVGVVGACALLTEAGELVAVADMPILADGPAGRPTINPALLADIVRRWQPARAWVEFVGARPGEGAVGAFAFGRSAGAVAGVLATLGVASATIAPAAWKRVIGIPPGKEGAKDAARAEAIRRWPSHSASFARKRDDGRAEACLIALAGMMRERSR